MSIGRFSSMRAPRSLEDDEPDLRGGRSPAAPVARIEVERNSLAIEADRVAEAIGIETCSSVPPSTALQLPGSTQV